MNKSLMRKGSSKLYRHGVLLPYRGWDKRAPEVLEGRYKFRTTSLKGRASTKLQGARKTRSKGRGLWGELVATTLSLRETGRGIF